METLKINTMTRVKTQLDIRGKASDVRYTYYPPKRDWYCIKYFQRDAIKQEWRQFEGWTHAQTYGELMYGDNLWQITS